MEKKKDILLMKTHVSMSNVMSHISVPSGSIPGTVTLCQVDRIPGMQGIREFHLPYLAA